MQDVAEIVLRQMRFRRILFCLTQHDRRGRNGLHLIVDVLDVEVVVVVVVGDVGGGDGRH